MPWSKTGRVSVTNNSNSVIGVGTSFIVNGRVGDAFRGPDGSWYEVTNIASDTAMSISPNYQGVTDGAGGYALAPLQGYVKESADTLRALVNTYGTKLAALGATANFDVLPVSKGGTGGVSPAAARAALELGSAASATLQTTYSDATAGRVMQVGAFGIGGDAPVYNGNIDDTAAVPAGRCFVINTATGVKPTGSPYGLMDTIKYAGQPVHQAWHEVNGTAGGGTLRTWERDQYGTGVFGPWRMVYRQNNILGVVSGAGAPTGAIIERGANGNGEYTKFADGTLVCWRVIPTNSTGTYAVGALFGSDAYAPGPFPSAYASVPTVTSGATGAVHADCIFASAWIPPALNNWGGWRAMATTNVAAAAQINLIAIGRWY
ncbi:phage tail protein [Pseudomonas sp. RU47]|uniref:phage tail protein n=1 Tax=Pseudomonas sp. RU47 TaxID=2005388 RepID=UPI001EE84620|nr:phage tail protein [Pseudomonas sp. RU47]